MSLPPSPAADTLRAMAGIDWTRARWAVLYILSTHGDIHLDEVKRIAQERFGIEITGYMMGKFRSRGILTWPPYVRIYSITDKGRAELAATDPR